MAKFVIGVVLGLFMGTATNVYGVGAAGPGVASGWTFAEDGDAVLHSDPPVTISSSAMDRLN